MSVLARKKKINCISWKNSTITEQALKMQSVESIFATCVYYISYNPLSSNAKLIFRSKDLNRSTTVSLHAKNIIQPSPKSFM